VSAFICAALVRNSTLPASTAEARIVMAPPRAEAAPALS
jgi:hypothetical protein